jgi:tRNA (adenine37-N6)-methyltransferase
MYSVQPIGVVRCPVNEMSLGNWSKIDSEIHIDPAYAGGLQGLEGFSHVQVVFFLDRAQGFDFGKHLLRAPRDMKDMHKVGVFAWRTKYRPNPIGVTSVPVRGIEGNVIKVRGLDALDATPILDVKPYIPEFDRIDDVKLPAWVAHVMEGYF